MTVKYAGAGESFLSDYVMPAVIKIGADDATRRRLEAAKAAYQEVAEQLTEIVNEVTAYRLEEYHMDAGERWTARRAYSKRMEALEARLTLLTEEWLAIGRRHSSRNCKAAPLFFGLGCPINGNDRMRNRKGKD